jgi:hypothetical protein
VATSTASRAIPRRKIPLRGELRVDGRVPYRRPEWPLQPIPERRLGARCSIDEKIPGGGVLPGGSRVGFDVNPDDLLAWLEQARQVTLHPPVDAAVLEAFEREQSARLPAVHRRLLLRTNGFEAFGGTVRVFGIGNGAGIDIRVWNAWSTWRFAWAGKADPYLCIGESAWGGQYAYRRDELQPRSDPRVYSLLQVDCSVVYEFRDFESYLDSGGFHGAFLVDGDTRRARERLGDLRPDEHYVQVEFFEPLDPERVVKANAVETMILYGDMERETSGQPPGREYERLEYFQDDQGRTRVRVIWKDATG